METALNPGMCRCCASEGAFKDIKSTYHWMGEEEVYADMLRECFDVILNASGQGEDSGICEVCITQLRNAINFKKQVLHTEEQFQKHLQNKTLFRPNIVKVEMQGEEESDDNMASGDEGFSGAEYEVPIKTELEDPKPKKRAAKAAATTTRASAKKAKADNGETSTKRNEETVGKESEITNNVESAVVLIVGPREVRRYKRYKVNTSLEPYVSELNKHRHNVRQVLQFSNATPILRRGGVGYVCSYCFREFPDPHDLKKHTMDNHESETNPLIGYSKSSQMAEYHVKVDITNLECTECAMPIDSLEDLKTHLQKEHTKLIYDIPNHIIPFKFETDTLTCCLCNLTFDKFKKLQEHMHSHYRNYICEECDAGFVTQGCLTRHRNATHATGVFPCSYCPKVYDTALRRRSHVRCNHTHTDVLNRCGYCNKGFRDHHRKELHISEVHGVEPILYKCNACDKSYTTKRKLRLHVQRDHLLERRHRCLTCDKRFFSSTDVKFHMLTHTGEREFKCEICLKSYGRKSTLTTHMRIHNEDRKFKCDSCGMTFVQKCSLRSHMKTKHGETVD